MLIMWRELALPTVLQYGVNKSANNLSENPAKCSTVVNRGQLSFRLSLFEDQIYSYTHSLQYGFRTAFKTLRDLQHFKSLSSA